MVKKIIDEFSELDVSARERWKLRNPGKFLESQRKYDQKRGQTEARRSYIREWQRRRRQQLREERRCEDASKGGADA